MASSNGLFVGEIEGCINSLEEIRAHKDWVLDSDSTISDVDRKPTPRELQALIELDSEVEDNESAGSGNFDHEKETVIAPHAGVNCVEEGSGILEVYGGNYGDLIKTNQTNVGLVMEN
jgi:hypothetical protein